MAENSRNCGHIACLYRSRPVCIGLCPVYPRTNRSFHSKRLQHNRTEYPLQQRHPPKLVSTSYRYPKKRYHYPTSKQPNCLTYQRDPYRFGLEQPVERSPVHRKMGYYRRRCRVIAHRGRKMEPARPVTSFPPYLFKPSDYRKQLSAYEYCRTSTYYRQLLSKRPQRRC